MTLPASEHMISRQAAGRLGIPEIELMTKVLLIEDDGGTAEEIVAELSELGFDVERDRRPRQGSRHPS
jgi:hypothetical protein